MKINSITLNKFSNNISYNSVQKKENNPENNNTYNSANLPSIYPVSFTGGKSMSLAETKIQLDKRNNAYPKDIKEKIIAELRRGNPKNKTLIDIHKEKYSALSECETVEDIKQKFPGEFDGIISDKDAKYNDGTFIKDVKEGRIEGFDPEKDVTVQLMQLYWGEGFSLSTLKDTFSNNDIEYSMRKLNIPRTEQQYGLYLKLSDKDYNARYTAEMSKRSEEIAKKHFINNPEKIHELPAKKLKDFEKHPEEKEKFSIVLLRAWRYPEAKGIRKKLSEYIKHSSPTFDDIKESITPLSPVNMAFRKFWKENLDAKSDFSACLKKSWQKQMTLTALGLTEEPFEYIDFAPSSVRKDILSYAKDKGQEISQYIDVRSYDEYITRNPEEKAQALETVSDFYKENPQKKKDVMYARLYGIINTLSDFAKENIKTKGKEHSDLSDLIGIFEENISSKKTTGVNNNDIFSLYQDTIRYCCEHNKKDIESFNNNINSAYKKIKAFSGKEKVDYANASIKELVSLLPQTYKK